VPILLLGHLVGVLPVQWERAMRQLGCFVCRVCTPQGCASNSTDIGDKSVFAYLKEQHSAKAIDVSRPRIVGQSVNFVTARCGFDHLQELPILSPQYAYQNPQAKNTKNPFNTSPTTVGAYGSGWGVAIACLASLTIFTLTHIHPFLAVTSIKADVVVEGWLPDYAIKNAL